MISESLGTESGRPAANKTASKMLALLRDCTTPLLFRNNDFIVEMFL